MLNFGIELASVVVDFVFILFPYLNADNTTRVLGLVKKGG